MKMRTLFAVGMAVVSAVLFWALPAQAAETIYWDNYLQTPASIGFSAIDGSGGGLLNTAGATIEDPEGMSYDSATGRIYVASSNNDEIVWVNVDGSGTGTLSAPGAPIEDPEGVAIDPASRTVYWVNAEGNGEAGGSIAWAKLDGSSGGMLNTTGATLSEPYRLAIDPAGGRVYWTNFGPTPQLISYANLDNSGGGGDLDVSGASEPNDDGLAVDSAAGRIYWLNSESISYASVGGGNGGDLEPAGATFDSPYGLAVDPAKGMAYWANYGVHEGEPNGIGFETTLGTGGGALTPSALTDGPQDPVILKSPSGTGAPAVTRTPATTNLACSQGSWAPDYAGGFVYQAPQSYAYQWLLNGAAIPGANASTYTGTAPGSYTCSVTGTNHNGSATQTSGSVELVAGKLTLGLKKHKARTKAAKAAAFGLVLTNSGDFPVKGTRLCVKEPKKAKKAVKAPKCRSLGTIAAGKKRTLKVRVKALGTAEGTYKLTFLLRGKGGAKPVKAKLLVKPTTTKKRGGKHRH